jgi:hypothetical protein
LLPPPPTSEILAFKEAVAAYKEFGEPSLPKPRRIGGTAAPVPEPAAWALASLSLSLVLWRRSIHGGGNRSAC